MTFLKIFSLSLVFCHSIMIYPNMNFFLFILLVFHLFSLIYCHCSNPCPFNFFTWPSHVILTLPHYTSHISGIYQAFSCLRAFALHFLLPKTKGEKSFPTFFRSRFNIDSLGKFLLTPPTPNLKCQDILSVQQSTIFPLLYIYHTLQLYICHLLTPIFSISLQTTWDNDCLALLTILYSKPSTVPGTHWAINKFLLNKQMIK